MGRAARTKRQRGQTRTWHTRNPWTGKPETFPVCISDKALRGWEKNRVQLAKEGYPDRPPEFVGRRDAVWSAGAPGRPLRRADIDGVAPRLAADRTATVLGAWLSEDRQTSMRINVGRRDDGTFVLHLVFQTRQEQTSRVMTVANEEGIRAVVSQVNTDIAALVGLPPLRWTSADEVLAEIAEAA